MILIKIYLNSQIFSDFQYQKLWNRNTREMLLMISHSDSNKYCYNQFF